MTASPASLPCFRVRASTPSDAAAVQRFVSELSAESAYRRFLAPTPRLSDAHARAIVDVDHHACETLIAEAVVRNGPAVVGVAQYVSLAPGVAELAIVITDTWQRRGIGTRLLRRLITLAERRGITEMRGDYLSSNRAIVRLVERMPGGLELASGGVVSVLTLRIAADRPAVSTAAA